VTISIDDLPDNIELLKAFVIDLERQRQELQSHNDYLKLRLADLLERRSSSRPDQVPDGQLLLAFAHELAEKAQKELAAAIEEAKASVAPDTGQQPSNTAPKTGRKRGRRPLPTDLLRVRSVFEIDEAERLCSCGTAMPEIGEITSEELVRLEMLFVHELVKKKYGCNRCEDGVLVARGPERVLPKSMAGPSLLAWVISAKFGDYLPYYRLERLLERQGAPVSRATLCNWMRGCGELLEPIADEVLRQILAESYLQTDDTSKLIQRGKEGKSRYGHVWGYTTPDGKVYYDFTETRERHGPLRVLGDYEGYVQADAYSGYDELFRLGKAKEVGCWAHAKRKFDDAKEQDPENAAQALAAIRALYDIESEAKRRCLSTDARKAFRAERAPPILSALKCWLEAELVRALPRSDMAQALGYVLNQWAALTRYLEDGRIEIDNNGAERLMKPVAIGRKNDLFVFTEETGKSAAVLMSLVESCKTIGVDPVVYFNDVLQVVRNDPRVDVGTLTPSAWRERRDEDGLRRAQREQAQAQLAAAVLANQKA
jgi:transposase